MLELSCQAIGNRRDTLRLCGGADPEHDRPPGPNEWEAELGGDGGLGERLRDSYPPRVRRLFLRTAPNDVGVRQLALPTPQELALAPFRLEQRHLPLWERNREGNSGRTASGAHVDDRALERAHDLEAAQSVVQQDAAGLTRVTDGRQAWRSDDLQQPALEKISPRLQ